jgi:hypothetical protein
VIIVTFVILSIVLFLFILLYRKDSSENGTNSTSDEDVIDKIEVGTQWDEVYKGEITFIEDNHLYYAKITEDQEGIPESAFCFVSDATVFREKKGDQMNEIVFEDLSIGNIVEIEFLNTQLENDELGLECIAVIKINSEI